MAFISVFRSDGGVYSLPISPLSDRPLSFFDERSLAEHLINCGVRENSAEEVIQELRGRDEAIVYLN